MQEPAFWDLQKIKAASNRCFQTVDKVPGIRSGFFYEKSLEIQHLWGLSGSFLV